MIYIIIHSATTASVEIKDAYGTTLVNQSLNVSLTNVTINVSSLSPGTYYAVLICDSTPQDSKNLVVN